MFSITSTSSFTIAARKSSASWGFFSFTRDVCLKWIVSCKLNNPCQTITPQLSLFMVYMSNSENLCKNFAKFLPKQSADQSEIL
jgi:hypothetical protein